MEELAAAHEAKMAEVTAEFAKSVEMNATLGATLKEAQEHVSQAAVAKAVEIPATKEEEEVEEKAETNTQEPTAKLNPHLQSSAAMMDVFKNMSAKGRRFKTLNTSSILR